MVKKIFSLNTGWYIIAANDSDSSEFHKYGIPADEAVIGDLPAYTHMYIEDHTGISWYQKIFNVEYLPGNHERAILAFEYADFRAEVSVNGIIVGEHTGPEEPFSFDITDLICVGENRLTVRVSKPYEIDVDGYSFGEVPHRNQLKAGITPGSCYNESGLPGDVTLKYLPDVRIEDLFVRTNTENGDVMFTVTVHSDRSRGEGALLRLGINRFPDGEPEDQDVFILYLRTGDNVIEKKLNVPAFEWWSTDDPVLYNAEAEVECGDTKHRKSTRTGFRTFEVRDDGYFCLNGKRIFLKCSHTGNAMPESTHHLARDRELLRKDFLMAKASGFNMIRFISGAALPVQLDLCDEIGLMIYEEPAAGWLTMNGSHAAENYLNELRAIIKRDRNHPCITVWGLLNETQLAPPYDEVCRAAMDALPAVRELDPTRLVLFSSGRWDARADIGSVSNPYTDIWQTLWNGEGQGENVKASLEKGVGHEIMGDIHFYPNPVPMSDEDIDFMRRLGCKYKRPVFMSEFGIGSLLDTQSLVKGSEQKGYSFAAPDIKMVKRMNDLFESEMKKYGFDRLFPFYSELMLASMKNHADYRTQLFDILRSNKYINGLSITGLLDHSICGEGLWTNFREFKPMIADVLQDGLSSLRWCIILPKTAVFKGDPIKAEIYLANEDVLIAGRSYTVRSGLVGDHVYEMNTFELVPDREGAQSFALHVLDTEFSTAELSEGRYKVKFDLLNGADPSGTSREIAVFGHVKSSSGRDVYVTGISDDERKLLDSHGFKVREAGTANKSGDLIFAGHITEENRELLSKLLEKGAVVVAARAYENGDGALGIIPEERRPARSADIDWLYRKETVLSPESDYFRNVPAGMCDSVVWKGVMTDVVFDAGEAPDVTDAVAFSIGYPNPRGYTGGFKLASYRIGEGTLIVNGFNLLDSASYAPMAERILVNILDYS